MKKWWALFIGGALLRAFALAKHCLIGQCGDCHARYHSQGGNR